MGLRFGKFSLIEKLASGGMGEVFLTRGVGAGGVETSLVLKRILPHLSGDKDFLDLFLNEARTVARLSHPNIVQIFELGDVEGAWYLLMEHVAGKDLRQLIDRLKRRRKLVPLGLACRIAADAAAALDHAHRARDAQGRPMKIVHRDVSPHNVLLSFDGAVKLIDFGVAKAAGRAPTGDDGMLRGKYPYMSPEQATSGELDHRSDQFSLGVVLWELITGKRLFKADNDALTLDQVARCEVKPPSRKDEAVPAGLVAVVMRALQKDPAARFPDTGALRSALEELALERQWPATGSDLAQLLSEFFPQGTAREPGETSSPAAAPLAEGSGSPEQVESSWKLLQPHEQLALAQLSVLDEDFSLEAAEAVIDLSSYPRAPWALDVVQALRDRSLVRSWEAAEAPGELRFGLASSARDFARAQLKSLSADVEPAARARYAAWRKAALSPP